MPTADGLPASWTSTPQTLVDVGRLAGANGKPTDRHLCGPPTNPNLIKPTLKPGAQSPFVTRLSSPPPDARNVNIRFAEAGDAQ